MFVGSAITREMTIFAVALIGLCGLMLSLLLERWLVPKPRAVWRRPISTAAIHAGVWFLLFAFEFALFHRPWFAMAQGLGLVLLVVVVSNAKVHSLREPFVFQDFDYFIDLFKHPRLYLPFFGLWRASLGVLLFVLLLWGGMVLEMPITDGLPMVDFLLVLSVAVALGAALVWCGAAQVPALTYDAGEDLQNFGLIATLWHYGAAERRCSMPASPFASLQAPSRKLSARRPTLVVVQSESFFDARRLSPQIRREVLKEFDRRGAESLTSGTLVVPAWGANTVRTEFAVLSGLAAEQLGVHRFNPYRTLDRRPQASLASYLKRLGYRTVCVHPYPASFYRRDQVLPALGFDEFIDIAAFADSERFGPSVSDLAVADKLCSLIDEKGDQPLFIYVITMENHGPLHLETLLPGDAEQVWRTEPAAGCEDLAIYLRHLANADRMLARLTERLNRDPAPAGLCWFGDHVPIMPGVYSALGVPAAETDFLIWQNREARNAAMSTPPTVKQRMDASSLGMAFLRTMALLDEVSL